ncbi:MAG TPA: phage tail sheath C-terminal domain-containing protein [Acidimicrobiales bacterium]|nr:phage tail sheath C-terminal domain-containing protein [Acidimicrobiales bacterium]
MAIDPQTPGVYVEELPGGPRPIQAVGTSTAGFVGVAPLGDAHLNEPYGVNNWTQFVREFVGESTESTHLCNGVFGFFQNGGQRCYVVNVGPGNTIRGATGRDGINALAQIDEVAIVAAPGFSDLASHTDLIGHCETLQDRVAILDPPEEVPDPHVLTIVESESGATRRRRGDGDAAAADAPAPASAGLRPPQSDRGFAAFYFPWIRVRDALNPKLTVAVPPSGHMAGIWARNDASRGVHKAPANEAIRGALGVTYVLTDAEQAELNPRGVNCIRFFTQEGIRVWGARTIADGAGEWRYLNVRRLFNMIEESIKLSTRWIVFEPNDRTLWKSIRRDVTAFLTLIWRNGALMGRVPEEAFFVKCDEETNPPNVVNAGRVVTVIGIAPVKPAEFIIFQISQYAGGAEPETEE